MRVLLGVVLPAWLLIAPACARVQWPDTPALVYLTWQGDPMTTMTVRWVSAEGVTGDHVAFGRVGEPQLRTVTGRHHRLTHADRIMHVVELKGLDPGRDYRFRIAGLAARVAGPGR